MYILIIFLLSDLFIFNIGMKLWNDNLIET